MHQVLAVSCRLEPAHASVPMTSFANKLSRHNVSVTFGIFDTMAIVATTDRCLAVLQCGHDHSNVQVLATTTLSERRAVQAMKKRLQDRLYERKYRAKRKQQIQTLEYDVQALQSKTLQLHRYVHRLNMAVNTAEAQRLQHPKALLHNHAQSIVMHFFYVYQNGFSLPMAGLQERFLRSILATDVMGVDICGVDAFVQQWRLYDQYFALCVLEPQFWKTQKIGDQFVIIEVEVMLYLRFHRQTIGILFPILNDSQLGPEFIQPLITGTTTVTSMYTFVVGHTGYVSNLMVSWQLLQTLRRVFGSLQNVAQLIEHTHIDLSSGTITVA